MVEYQCNEWIGFDFCVFCILFALLLAFFVVFVVLFSFLSAVGICVFGRIGLFDEGDIFVAF